MLDNLLQKCKNHTTDTKFLVPGEFLKSSSIGYATKLIVVMRFLSMISIHES